MKRSARYQALLNDLASEYRNAPIDEEVRQYSNYFTRHYRTIGVELCHGQWHTFSRYGAQECPHVMAHADRESARAYALQTLGL